jgi:hypothetical protein
MIRWTVVAPCVQNKALFSGPRPSYVWYSINLDEVERIRYLKPMDTKKAERRLTFTFGIVFVIVMLVLAIAYPSPTPFQYTVFRITLALAAAGVAAMIPGFIELRISTFLRAGGALAVFAIVYFYNPATLVLGSQNYQTFGNQSPIIPNNKGDVTINGGDDKKDKK